MQQQNIELDEEQKPINFLPNEIVPNKALKQDKEIITEKQKKQTQKTANFKDLFFFAKKKDKIMIFFAALFSLGQGFLLPALSLLFGDITNDFAPSENKNDNLLDQVFDSVKSTSIKMILVGVGVFCASLIANILWQITSNNQIRELKREYFSRLISQNCTWYDKQSIESLSTEFVTHTDAFEEIMSNKLHIFFMSIGIIIGGFVIGFVKGWLFTLCIIGLSPIMILGVVYFGKNVLEGFKVQSEAYSEAGAISDQVFAFIKTIKSFNGEDHEYNKYKKACEKAKIGTQKFNRKAAFFFGFFMFTVFFIYGLSFLIGSRLISENVLNHNSGNDYNVGDVLAIFFAVITGIFGFQQIGPILKAIEAGKLAMTSVFKILNSDSLEKSGQIKQQIKGEIEFKNVTFSYPSKPDKIVLKNVSFKISPGQKVAIVGPSGCGKSTCVQLLQRYYEPNSGTITLDGIEIQNYDLKFLRSEIGLVSQQPVLFADTIKNNILLGAQNKNEISDEQIYEALQQAQAQDFVKGFEKGLDEFVGNLGGQLSGGQKQRIAIARSLVKNPKIFLFDEATSALDRKNEKEIQKTIDKIVDQFTSITIAHRLSTIQNSDVIIVMKDGEIIEQGTHENLVQKQNGFYKNLVKNQILNLQQQNEHEIENEIQDDNKLDQEENVSLIQQSSIQQKSSIINQKSKKKMSLNQFLGNEKKLIIPGVICATLNGATLPLLGFLLAKVLGVLQKFQVLDLDDFNKQTYGFDKSDLLWESDKYVIGFTALSVAIFIFNFFQFYIFQYIGQNFTATLRSAYFRRLLYQDLVFFDRRGNEPGSLSQRLSSDCNTINILVSTYIGSIFQSLSSFITGIVIAFFASWRISLVTLALSPILIFTGIIESAIWAGAKKEKVLNSSKLSETVNNIKIIKSLTAENNIKSSYKFQTINSIKKKQRKGFLASIMLSLSQMAQFVVYGIVFLVGAVFVRDNGLSFTNLMVATFTILFGAYGAGMANQFAGDISKAKESQKQILNELEQKSKIEFDKKNPQINPKGVNRQKPQLDGDIEFKNVYFRYEGRKNWVLKNVSFKINMYKSHALVGSSGSGKSTIFQLIQRFYDIQKGQILFSNNDIKNIDLHHLRSLFGVVNQEPFLFNGNIEYNIKYNDQNISDEKMKEAAINSNSYDFIMSNDDLFKRDVGNRGEHLSGGQKQRINIARCLARNSKILLFDEATSALDSISEKQVQDAIEKVSKERTSISIAHRISTIKNCDMIFVFEDGIILEQGDYQKLVNQQGVFYDLANN